MRGVLRFKKPFNFRLILFCKGVAIVCATGICGLLGGLPESTISCVALEVRITNEIYVYVITDIQVEGIRVLL